ncbi:DUF1003 domain-containing protein [Nitratireductor indicus]|uniref:DUF1003 domain-containing protein n=1 Tax=Nitratireductor indicus TaxID=721133 RepID=UPI002874279B|nr:DUF1003 domain-containing protein [Nitratireductor indicus]MDS1134571.1 DUF1003 domain-containing protein [Nitratireductor indicus]
MPARNLHKCHVCGKEFPARQLLPYASVRPGISALIQSEHPGWEEGKFICKPDMGRFRRAYVEHLLVDERGELGRLEQEVLDSMEKGELITRPESEAIAEHSSFGERLADRVATFGGSWTFIVIFGLVIIVWMSLNVSALLFKPFDPYPFILLNLALSCLAAIQAPIIMMSQNRQDTKDRIRSENDYKINLKAELEIRQLHEKIDHQLARQWERLAEIQEIQIELLEERRSR